MRMVKTELDETNCKYWNLDDYFGPLTEIKYQFLNKYISS